MGPAERVPSNFGEVEWTKRVAATPAKVNSDRRARIKGRKEDIGKPTCGRVQLRGGSYVRLREYGALWYDVRVLL